MRLIAAQPLLPRGHTGTWRRHLPRDEWELQQHSEARLRSVPRPGAQRSAPAKRHRQRAQTGTGRRMVYNRTGQSSVMIAICTRAAASHRQAPGSIPHAQIDQVERTTSTAYAIAERQSEQSARTESAGVDKERGKRASTGCAQTRGLCGNWNVLRCAPASEASAWAVGCRAARQSAAGQ